MKLLALNLILVLCLFQTSTGQISNFEIEEQITHGPYLIKKSNNLIFTYWSNTQGNIFLDGIINNPDPIVYQTLHAITFDESGKLINKKVTPAKIEKIENRYKILDAQTEVVRDYNTVLASSIDEKFESINEKYGIKSYPFFLDGSETKVMYVANCFGKGLSGKSPFKIDIDKYIMSSDGLYKTKESVRYKVDYLIDTPNQRWQETGEDILNKDSGVYLCSFNKWVRKDKSKKYNHFKEYKFSAFNFESGEIHSKVLTFDRSVARPTSGIVYNQKGNSEGFYFTYQEAFGIGMKKANENPNKKHLYVILFDSDGKYIETHDFDLPYEQKMLSPGMVTGVLKVEDKYTALINSGKYENKEKGYLSVYLEEGYDTEANFINSEELTVLEDLEGKFYFGMPYISKPFGTKQGGTFVYGNSYKRDFLKEETSFVGISYCFIDSKGVTSKCGNFSYPHFYLPLEERYINVEQINDTDILLSVTQRGKGSCSKNSYFIISEQSGRVKPVNYNMYKSGFVTQQKIKNQVFSIFNIDGKITVSNVTLQN